MSVTRKILATALLTGGLLAVAPTAQADDGVGGIGGSFGDAVSSVSDSVSGSLGSLFGR